MTRQVTVGDNSAAVMEAGLSNLTQGDAPALLHKNGKTERWVLVRLRNPKFKSGEFHETIL